MNLSDLRSVFFFRHRRMQRVRLTRWNVQGYLRAPERARQGRKIPLSRESMIN